MDGMPNGLNSAYKAAGTAANKRLNWVEQLNPVRHLNGEEEEDYERESSRHQQEQDQQQRFTAKLVEVLIQKGLLDENEQDEITPAHQRFAFKFNPKAGQLEVWHLETKQLVLEIPDEELMAVLGHLDEPLPPGLLTSTRG